MFRTIVVLLGLVAFRSHAQTPPLSHDELMKKAAKGFVNPPWRDRLLASRQLWVGYAYGLDAKPLGERKLLDAEQIAKVKKGFDHGFTTSPLKCIVHIDGAVFTDDGTTVAICFGCGVLVVNGESWHGVDGDAMRALFGSVLGERKGEPNFWEGL